MKIQFSSNLETILQAKSLTLESETFLTTEQSPSLQMLIIEDQTP